MVHNLSKIINSNASQDLHNFTATDYDIFNLAILLIFSINRKLGDIWFSIKVSAKSILFPDHNIWCILKFDTKLYLRYLSFTILPKFNIIQTA